MSGPVKPASAAPTLLPVTVTGAGLKQISAQVGNTPWTATERGGTWELEQVAPGPLCGGLTKAEAEALLLQLGELVKAARRRFAPCPRTTCPACSRNVAVIRGAIGWHNAVEPGPGVEPKICRGTGAKFVEAPPAVPGAKP